MSAPSNRASTRLGFLAAALLFVTGPLAAVKYGHPAQNLVQDTTDAVFAALETDPAMKTETERLYALVEHLILPHFDFSLMAMRVLGKHWRRVDEAEQQAFAKEFQRLLVRTYSTALSSYAGQKVNMLPLRGGAEEDRVLVRTTIEGTGPVPIAVDYAMYRNGTSWKVYDVTIEGVSLVVTYRASFTNEIRAQGLKGLIERLREKNESQ